MNIIRVIIRNTIEDIIDNRVFSRAPSAREWKFWNWLAPKSFERCMSRITREMQREYEDSWEAEA